MSLVHWPILTVLLALSSPAQAQVSIDHATINEFAIGPTTLFRASITNSGPPVSVVLAGELHARSGGGILTFSSAPLLLNSGHRDLSASELTMEAFRFGPTEVGQAVAQDHRLTAGSYGFCLRVARSSGTELGDEYCDEMAVDDVLFMDPVWPMDRDTIDELRPVLSWSISSRALPPGQMARAVLVPCEDGNAARALARSRPIYSIDGVAPPMVIYPEGAPSLLPGTSYAWQIERSVGGIVIDRTEPWVFHVRKNVLPPENKYVDLLRASPNTVYEVRDKKIFFRYDRAYAGTGLNCAIHDERGAMQVAAPLVDGQGSGPTSKGLGLYMLDLRPYGLRQGYYQLVVTDEKEGVYTLKFHLLP